MRTLTQKELMTKLRAGEAPPSNALRSLCSVTAAITRLKKSDGGDDAGTPIPVNIKARARGPINHWYFGNVYHNLATMRSRPTIAIDDSHEIEVGHGTAFQTEYGLEVEGAVFPDESNAQHASNRIAYNLRKGIPQEASIDFTGDYDLLEVPEGMSYPVNGLIAKGPCLIVENWQLRAVAICKEGADSTTETVAQLAADAKLAPLPQHITTLATSPIQESHSMITLLCKPCNKNFEYEKLCGDGTVVCPHCKVKLTDKGELFVAATPPPAGAPQKSQAELAAEAEVQRLSAEAVTKDTEIQKLKDKLSAAGNAGAAPVPGASRPGNAIPAPGEPANFVEAVQATRLANPGKDEVQIHALATKKYPALAARLRVAVQNGPQQ